MKNIRSGIPDLDGLLSGGGIITLRSNSRNWLSYLAANIIVRSHNLGPRTQNPKPKTGPDETQGVSLVHGTGRRSIGNWKPDTGNRVLYLHWVDYHKRYWTIDSDLIMHLAKSTGQDFNPIAENLYFMRAFSRDNTENEENWKMIFEFADDLNLVLLDTLSDLYHLQKKRPVFQKTFAYALGRFARICMRNDCPGIILDSAFLPIHPFLGEISSTIIEFHVASRILLNLKKHPCIEERSFCLQLSNQRTLGEWL